MKLSRTISLYHILTLCTLLLVACVSETDAPELPGQPGEGVTLTLSAGEMLPQIVASRADVAEQKTAEEKRINTVHLFFFGSDGDFLEPVDPEKFAPYQRYDFTGLQPHISIPADAFVGQSQLTDVTIYAVVNIFGTSFRTEWTPDGDIIYGAPDDPGAEVTVGNISDLDNWVYRPQLRDDISKLPAPGMPMVGYNADKNITLTGDGDIKIMLTALMARVDVDVSLDASQPSSDGTLPELTVREFGVKNMPSIVPLFTAADYTTVTSDDEIVREKTVAVEAPEAIHHGNGHTVFSYYTYENIREADRANFGGYPAGVDESDPSVTQRWKPRLAPADASALVIRGNYITNQSLDYDAQFTFYLGNNTVDNFEVRRNRCYKNNITIRGLDYVRNTDETVFTFDARVNVVTDNPLYVSIVNERRIDAHWGVLPMDLYFLDGAPAGATCDVDILDPATDWVHLEYCSSEGMADADFHAGWGCRDYFTTDMLTAVVTGTTATARNSRDRIYFYVDENASTTPRKAFVRLTYNPNNGEEPTVRTLELEQAGLLPFTSGGTTYYMEAYEEYAEHRDPLDLHTESPWYQPSGIPWAAEGSGLRDVELCIYGYKFPKYDIRPFDSTTANGLRLSNYVFKMGGDVRETELNIPGFSDGQIYSSAPAYSAYHYAVEKNKRNSDGSVSSIVWFLPGISELESALETYPATSEFSQFFYWSANPAKRSGVTIGNAEDTSRARATKLSNGSHVDSGVNSNYESGGGRTLRTQKLRVRAIRVADGVSN